MAATWRIKEASESGDGDTLATLGIEELRIAFRNRAADEAVFTIPGDTYHANPGFTHGVQYAITKTVPDGNSTRTDVVFIGRLASISHAAETPNHRRTVRLLGGWAELESYVYTQPWKQGSGNTSGSRSRVILGLAYANDVPKPISFDMQIASIVGRAGSVTLGTCNVAGGNPGTKAMPYDEQVDLTCAEALKRVLAWVPDTQVWFTYDTGHTVMHVARLANCGSRTASASAAESLECTPRPDLQVPNVILYFEKTGTQTTTDPVTQEQTTSTYKDVEKQYYPNVSGNDKPDIERGSLVCTIQLAGASTRTFAQRIKVRPIPNVFGDTGTAKTRWKKWIPWLQDIPDNALTVSDGSWVDADVDGDVAKTSWPPKKGNTIPNCPNEIVEGELPDWLENHKVVTVTLSVKVSYETATETVTDMLVSHTMTMTSAATGTYTKTLTENAGDSVPAGLARKLYDSLNRLYYEGRYVRVDEDPPGLGHPGEKFNISGANTAWASMDTPVQTVEWDVGRGRTTVEFGPPEHLGPQDLFQFMQANRRRNTAVSLAEKTSADVSASGSSVGGPGKTSDGTSGSGRKVKQVFSDPSANGGPAVTVNGENATVNLAVNVTETPEGGEPTTTNKALVFNPAATPEELSVIAGATLEAEVSGNSIILTLVATKKKLTKVSNALYSIEDDGTETSTATIVGGTCQQQ